MDLTVQAHPNPFTSFVSLEVDCKKADQVIFRLYSPSGKIIKMNYWKLVSGMNKIILDNLDLLTRGPYLVELRDQQEMVLFSLELRKE
jgi:hypothetical protein